MFLCVLGCLAPILVGAFLISDGMVAAGASAVVVGLIGLMLVSLVSSTLNTIILAALYLYAADHEVPPQFNSGLLQSAFARR